MQGRLTGREHRVASREQMLTRQDADSACQVAEAQAAAASAYRNARQDLDQEYKAHREALDRERRALEADRYCAAVVPFAAAGLTNCVIPVYPTYYMQLTNVCWQVLKPQHCCCCCCYIICCMIMDGRV